MNALDSSIRVHLGSCTSVGGERGGGGGGEGGGNGA